MDAEIISLNFSKIPSQHLFIKNYHALSAVVENSLLELLNIKQSRLPVDLKPSASGLPTAVIEGWNSPPVHDLNSPVESAIQEIRTVINPDIESLIMVGLGLGYHLGALCDLFPSLQKILVYERFPEFVKIALSIKDYSRDLLSGRVSLCTWQDYPHFRQMAMKFLSENSGIFVHPVLGEVYREELDGILSCNQYRKCKCAVLLTGLLSRDVVNVLENLGVETFPIDVLRVSEQSLASALNTHTPDFVFSINYIKGVADICYDLKIPLVIWEIDPSIEVLQYSKVHTGDILFYTYRKSRVNALKDAGFRRVEYLPLASNHHRFKPMDLCSSDIEVYGADIGYVGASMILEAERLFALFSEILPLSSDAIPVDLDALKEELREKQQRNLNDFVVPRIFHRHSLPRFLRDANGRLVDCFLCLGEGCASERRAGIINQLASRLPDFRIAVWGDDGWARKLADGVEYRGTAGHFHELIKIYNALKINLDINRIYQRDIVPLRVFDILASKGFLLADRSDELHELFGNAVISYGSVDELEKLVRYYLDHPDERDSIAEAGYTAVLSAHTLEHRLKAILADLEAFGFV